MAYGVWLATIILALGVAWIWRSALLGLFVRLRFDKYAYAAYNNIVVLALVLGWLVLVIVSEAWCRQATARGKLSRFAIRMFGTQFVLIALGYLLYVVGR
jgi:uncharacterized protein YjeT (DUF2065 family)